MKQFTGSWGGRLGILFMAVCGAGIFYFMVILPIQRSLEWPRFHPALLIASVPFGLFGLAMAGMCLYGVAESFSVYRVDDAAIEKHGVFGHEKMPWDTLASFETNRALSSNIVLTDRSGRRMRIVTDLIRDPGGELGAFIDDHTGALREAKRDEFGWQPKTYRPARGASWLCLVLVAAAVGFVLMYLLDPAAMGEGTPAQRWSFMGMLVGLSVASILLWAYLFTWTLTVGRGALTSASLFHRRTIPLDRIESVMSRDVQTKGGTVNVTTVEGAGQKITFSANMPDYALVCDYIRAQAGQQAVQRGEAAVPAVKRQETRQALILITLVCVLGYGGLSLYLMQDAHTRLARYDQIDRRGVRTMGRIDGRYTTGSKTTKYVVEYEFSANGRTYRHSSPVTRDDYDGAVPSRPISVIYVPDHPDLARADRSIGRREADGTLHGAYLFLALAVGTPLVFSVLLGLQARGKVTA